MESRSTLTRLSIPPRGDELFKMLTHRKRTEMGQCRARIAYLSALHRTIVPTAKESKMEKNLRKIKKRKIVEEIGRRGRKMEEGRGGNDLRLMKMAPRIGETLLEEGRRSSSSSGLQSITMESGRGSSEAEEEERENVGRKVGFKSEKSNDERKGGNGKKRNEGKTANGQNIQKPRQIGANEQSLRGGRMATLNTKNISNRVKSSSSSSPSAASIIQHQNQHVEHSSGQSSNGTKGKSPSGSKSSSSKSSSSSSSSSSHSQHSESKSKSSKSSSISSGQNNGSIIRSSESGSRSRSNSKTDSSITGKIFKIPYLY